MTEVLTAGFPLKCDRVFDLHENFMALVERRGPLYHCFAGILQPTLTKFPQFLALQ